MISSEVLALLLGIYVLFLVLGWGINKRMDKLEKIIIEGKE